MKSTDEKVFFSLIDVSQLFAFGSRILHTFYLTVNNLFKISNIFYYLFSVTKMIIISALLV